MPSILESAMKLSTDKIIAKTFLVFKRQFSPVNYGEYLDVGSGRGDLVRLIKNYAPNFTIRCLDYTSNLMSRDLEIVVDVVDLNSQPLPYETNKFDVVSCTEVIEHLENYRLLIRNIYRVTKPNGLVIFSTPNILNLLSRVRYLLIGFATLFGPLHVGKRENFSTNGHIMPISYFYLSHALLEAGFHEVSVEIDKKQSSSYLYMLIFYPFIYLIGIFLWYKEKKRQTIDADNIHIIKTINSINMLLGRTIIVSARKP